MDELLEIMQTAIRAEVEANKLYRRGEQSATSDDARELFRRLAEEEERHKRMLLAKYQEMTGQAFTQW